MSFLLAGWLALCALLVLEVAGGRLDPTTLHHGGGPDPTTLQHGGGGGAQCGDYSNRALEDGTCRVAATLPLVAGRQRCAQAFRCSAEMSSWLEHSRASRQQAAALSNTASLLHTHLRRHHTQLHTLDTLRAEQSQVKSLQQRLQDLELLYTESSSLQHSQHTAITHLQKQIHSLTVQGGAGRGRPGCVNMLQTSPLMTLQDTPHPEQPVRRCPVDCASVYLSGEQRSGLYTVLPALGARPVEVYCDMETEGGGWTVLQRRLDGWVSFDRGWRSYREGFGDPRFEFWLGLETMHQLTTQRDYSLRIDLHDWTNTHTHALYQSFRVDSEASRYRLHVSGFSGPPGTRDWFSWYHDQQAFSTPDQGHVCAQITRAGWWFNHCFYYNLNGLYHRTGLSSPAGRSQGPGVVLFSWTDSDSSSLRQVSMMLRPRAFQPRPSP